MVPPAPVVADHGSRKGQYSEQPPLPWKERLDIGLAILEGIKYLLEEIEGDLGIVHVDLKPENILLDEDRNPYIADFGSAVTIEKGNVDAFTQKDNFLGTFGYTDPVINNTGFVTSVSDIYSFGSIVLELMMGLELDAEKQRELDPVKIEKNITPDYVRQIMDPTLADQVSLEKVMEMVILATHSRKYDRETRPEIEEVTQRFMAIRNGN